MLNRVHPTMNRAQAQRFEAPGDRPPAYAELQQLTTGNQAMLPVGQLPNGNVDPGRLAKRIFGSYTVLNVRFAWHGPILAASVLRVGHGA
jgi:hypothetical protein